MSVLHRSRDDDAELARRVGAGDGAAFATLDARHRGALMRYAGSLLRRSEHDAEDVVQDVLIRAHDALRAGDRPDELRPWLYRLTRNRAIDEVRRKRWGDESLDADRTFTSTDREDPQAMLRRKESMRRLVEDLADLPLRQREALLARELDGLGPEEVAAQLGVSVVAAQKLAIRARENLIKTRDARDADCDVIRAVLLDAHERGVRPTEQGLRHVKGCDACRAYQRDIRRLSRQLHALSPALGLPVLAGLVKLAGGGAKAAGIAAAATATVAVVATGGVIVLKSEVHSPGDAAPFRLINARDSHGRPVTRGTPVPEGYTVVTARVRMSPVASRPPAHRGGPLAEVTLPCPKGMKLYGFELPDYAGAPHVNFTGEAIPGYSTQATLGLFKAPAHSTEFTVGISCRRPNAYGVVWPVTREFKAALKRGERRMGRICTPREYVRVHERPGGRTLGLAYRGSIVAIQGRARSGRWTRVVTDWKFAETGWIKTSDLCP